LGLHESFAGLAIETSFPTIPSLRIDILMRVRSSPFSAVLASSFISRAVVFAANTNISQFAFSLFFDDCTPEVPALTLVQLHVNVSTGNAVSSRKPGGASCTALANHGSYFSVSIEVGTPSQTFDVVADTGSDAVIVQSCLCQEVGDCSASDRCFQGTARSSTFSAGKEEEVPVITMEFGSGSIQSAISSDFVRVGSVQTTMDKGLLLMVSRHLDISGPFEGILGLGQLQAEYYPPQRNGANADLEHVSGFLHQANVDRFSICFNDGTSPGVLRLGTEKQALALPSVGTLHWGLKLAGMSVGSSSAPSLFCSDSDSRECGAIPDSGTTVMLGPEEHVREVFSGLCESWPRCQTAAATEFPDRKKRGGFPACVEEVRRLA
jgi:hypothetical protein